MKNVLIQGLAVAAIACLAVGLGRSRLVQDRIAGAEGYLLRCENPSQAFVRPSGETVQCEFRLTNVTRNPVEIQGVETGCGCSVATNVPVTLAGGETTPLRFSVSTSDQPPGETVRVQPEVYVGRSAVPLDLSILVTTTAESNRRQSFQHGSEHATYSHQSDADGDRLRPHFCRMSLHLVSDGRHGVRE